MYFGKHLGYPIHLSDKKDKKYYALVGNKKVYFGATNYEQYKDKVGYYSKDDHHDLKRKQLYYKRHSVDYPKGSSDWFAKKLLW